MWNPLNLLDRKWWYNRSRKVTVARTGALQSKVPKLRAAGAKHGVGLEESVLKDLRKKVYAQDKTVIGDLVDFFKTITDEQKNLSKEISSLRARIRDIDMDTENRKIVDGIMEDIDGLWNALVAMINTIRKDIEVVKSRIKDGDFRWAERRMVLPFNRKQEVDELVDEIKQKILNAQRLLLPADQDFR